MTSNDHNGTGREHLSALFDGELDGDAARFTLKRLVQDSQWRDACGNWQLAGDVLRGRSTAAAPAGFAARVQAALAENDAVLVAAAPRSSRHAARGWVGGTALAASIAAAALFIARPDQASIPDRVQPAALVAAASGTATAPATAPDIAPARPVDQGRQVVLVPTPAERDASMPAPQGPRERRPSRQVAPLPATATAAGADLTPGIDSPLGPFQQAADRIAVRPWPRAVLPGSAVAGSLTAGFAQGLQGEDGESPSFYPFDPRPSMTTADAARPQP